MRMWAIPAELLCKKHLIGEHGEIHKHKHNFVKKHSIKKRIFPIVQIEPNEMENRHNELALEMTKRGYNHNSPYELPDLSYLDDSERYAKANITISLIDLHERCVECSERINNSQYSKIIENHIN